MTTAAGDIGVRPRRSGRELLLVALVLLWGVALAGGASALTVIDGSADLDRIEVLPLGDVYDGQGDVLQVETAPGADGLAGRMAVRAANRGTSPNWFVFALRNPTDKPIERWLAADRYNLAGSGIVWPELDTRRIENVTPSIGFVPDRLPFDNADAFRLTIEPGQTVTFAVELAGDRLPRMQLWRALDYEKRSRNRQLFHGTLLGAIGLLAIFLTTVFAASHKAIFPTAALVCWMAFTYLCVDFGLWTKLFNIRPEENAQYRAAAEAGLAAAFVIFLHVFLRLALWNSFARFAIGLWIGVQLILIGVAFLDPKLASTFVRLSMGLLGVVGSVLVLYLSLVRWQDRALSLVPTWILLDIWLLGAALTMAGRLGGDVAVNSVITGLGLVIMVLGFTVTQYAFGSGEPVYSGNIDEQQVRSFAIDNTSAAVWEWNARRDEIRVDPDFEAALGLAAGQLNARADKFIERLHPADRQRLRQHLADIAERHGGEIRTDLRVRHADGSYRHFEIEAAALPARDRAATRVVGLIRETTDARRAQERLFHDAVRDTLTGLPNRVLLIDRLSIAIQRARTEPLVRPTVFVIDIDRFRAVNASLGSIAADSLLISIARRLARQAGPQDTVARVGADAFALAFTQALDAGEQAMIAENIRAALRTPTEINREEVMLTAGVGYAELLPGANETAADLLDRAAAAVRRAKRLGPDQVVRYDDSVQSERNDRTARLAELGAAIDAGALAIEYQPVMYLRTEELAGFEVHPRWRHPSGTEIDPAEYLAETDDTELGRRLIAHVLARVATDMQRWHNELPREVSPLFASINISHAALLTPGLVAEVRHILSRLPALKGTLRLEIAEVVLMENPERALQLLLDLSQTGVALSLDGFGIGYTSLTYVAQLPIDTIKVERAIVQAGLAGATGASMLRSVVSLSHELGRKVVADGLDVAEDIGLLRTIGCEYAQGQHCGPPQAQRETLQFLKGLRRTERQLKRRGPLAMRSRRREVLAADKPEAVADARPPVPAKAAESTPPQVPARGRPTIADRAKARPAPGRRPPPIPQQAPAPGSGAAPRANQPGMPGVQPAANIPASPRSLPPPAVAPLPLSAAQRFAEVEPLPRMAPPPPQPSMAPPPMAPAGPAQSVAAASASLAALQAEMAKPAAPANPNGSGHHAPMSEPPPSGGHPAPRAPEPPTSPPNLGALPPEIAASLARLAGGSGRRPPGE